MSGYLEELEAVAEDMARTLTQLRRYFMELAEQHPNMSTAAIDGILARYDRVRDQS